MNYTRKRYTCRYWHSGTSSTSLARPVWPGHAPTDFRLVDIVPLPSADAGNTPRWSRADIGQPLSPNIHKMISHMPINNLGKVSLNFMDICV